MRTLRSTSNQSYECGGRVESERGQGEYEYICVDQSKKGNLERVGFVEQVGVQAHAKERDMQNEE
jgi:hypothetical protein